MWFLIAKISSDPSNSFLRSWTNFEKVSNYWKEWNSKAYLYYENSSGSVRLFVCLYVRTSSTFLFLIRLAQQRYLLIPYKKGQVLRHFWSNSDERQEFFSFHPKFSIYIMKAGVCLSIRLSVCLFVMQLLLQFWTEKRLPFWPNHLSILWKQQWVCPSVCLSVGAYITYFLFFSD